MLYKELCEVYEELERNPSRLEKTRILAGLFKKIKHEKNKEIIYLLQGKAFPDYSEKEFGISEKLCIKALEKASGISKKEIINKWKKIGDLGKVAEEVMSKKKQNTLFSHKLTTDKVLDNLKKLPELTGIGTVDRKLSLISELLTSATGTEAKYIIRTLLNDLRIGVASGTIRDGIVESCFDKSNLSPEDIKKASEAVQNSYDKANDFALVFERGCKGIDELNLTELTPGKPIKVMLALKVGSIQEAFEKVGKPAACFPKGELIFSNPSIKEIQDFKKEKNLVIGKNGKFQKILKTFERPYFGKVIKIYPNYLFPFVLTPEHRVLIIKKQVCSWKNRNIICRPNCQEQKYGCKKLYKNYYLEWVEAKNIEGGDFILFPKFKETDKSKSIDLMDFNKDKKIETNRNKIRSYSKLKGTFKGNWINRYIKQSNEFFELMGWYLAEGSFDRSGIRFSLGYKEIKESERIKELVKKVFDIEAKINKRSSVIEIGAHSSLLPNFFKEVFGNYSTNKKIPTFILYAPPKKIKEFIISYIKGDGHKSKKDIYTIATASQNIAYQMILLLSKIGILPSVGKYKNRGMGDIIYKITIYGKQINNIEKNTHKTKTNHQRFFEDNNFFYIPIKKKEIQDYDGTVFNFETEDNTYLSSAIVHNCEYKYDGFRMLINKDEKGEIKIFTRRLDNVTKQFPDVVKYVKENINAKSFILDSEAVGYDPKTKKYKAFQDISQRIKRKYDIERLEKELPIEVNVFDILYYNGKSLINEPFRKRSELLRKIIHNKKYHLQAADQLITSSENEAQEFYEQALADNQEGVMIKNLESPYKPGARVGYMLKLKPAENESDLVITGAEYGTGKRAGTFSSFTLSCRDESNNALLEIGKASTGLKEKEELGLSYTELTNLIKPLITEEHGREVKVKPKIVVRIIYQNIQRSPTYESGFALRFPRITNLRPDRSVRDIATLEEIKQDYKRLEVR